MVWGALFAIFMAFSCIYCPNPSIAYQNSILPFCIQFCIYMSLIVFLGTDDGVNQIINIYCLAGIVFSLVCVLLFSNDLFSGRRFGYSMGVNPNGIMFSLTLPMCFLFYKAFERNIVDKKYLIGFILCFIVALCTGSKKTMVIAIFVSVFLMIREDRKRVKTILILAVVLLALCWAIFNIDFLYNSLGTRIEDLIHVQTIGDEADQTDVVRFQMRKQAFTMFLERPIFGYGCEAFRVLSGHNTYSHNNYVEILSSYGILGFALYYWLPIYMFVNACTNLKKNRDSRFCLIISLVCVYFVLDYGAVTTYSYYNMALFSILPMLYKNAKTIPE